MNSIKFLIINILLALPHAFITLCVDTGIMTGTTQTENAYMSAVLVMWLVYTWVYTYIKEFIRYYINRKANVTENFDKITNWIYCLVSMGTLFLLNRIRALGDVGDAIAITVAIFDIVFVSFKTRWIRESCFFEDLLFQEKFTDKELIKKERKKQIKAAKFGAIFGLFSIVIFLVSRFLVFSLVKNWMGGDVEFGIFAAIVSTIILHCIYVELFNKMSYSRLLKYRDINVKYYWTITDIAGNAFKVFAMIAYLVTLLLMKFNIILSLFIVLGIKWISQYKLWDAADPDYIPSGYGESNWSNESKQEKKPEFTYKTGYIKDQYGNITGTTSTVGYNDKYGGFETTEYKDNFGNVKGKNNTYKF